MLKSTLNITLKHQVATCKLEHAFNEPHSDIVYNSWSRDTIHGLEIKFTIIGPQILMQVQSDCHERRLTVTNPSEQKVSAWHNQTGCPIHAHPKSSYKTIFHLNNHKVGIWYSERAKQKGKRSILDTKTILERIEWSDVRLLRHPAHTHSLRPVKYHL
jgi:hypothetical protein